MATAGSVGDFLIDIVHDELAAKAKSKSPLLYTLVMQDTFANLSLTVLI